MKIDIEDKSFNQSLKLLGKDINDKDIDELKAILGARDRVSSRYISELDADEIFVFGSNLQGIHNWRASALARTDFHAEQGISEGLSGRSYAIPTTKIINDEIQRMSPSEIVKFANTEKKWKTLEEEDFESLPLETIKAEVQRFILQAKDDQKMNPNRKYYVTRIGCGYSAYKDSDIAPFFKEALKLTNVFLPQSFLNCLFNVKAEFDTPSQMVPFTNSGLKNFRKELEQQLSLYIDWLRDAKTIKKVYDDEIPIDILDDVEKLCGAIIKAVEQTFRGIQSVAYAELRDVLKEVLKKDNILKEENPGKSFYRMRVETDNWAKKNINRYGMFHIPYSLRGMVKTQRYSVPGYPCLYLGESILSCWEENGRPNLNSCLISRVENKNSFKYLDLRIPKAETWKNSDKQQMKNQILLFPLIIASTFKTNDRNANFKPEYIIPQLLLQYIKELAYKENKGKFNDERVIYGIRYTSVYITDDQKCGNNNNYDNYVIPVADIKNEYCSRLCSVFCISEPICTEYENIKMQSIEKDEKQQENKTYGYFDKLRIILESQECMLMEQQPQ